MASQLERHIGLITERLQQLFELCSKALLDAMDAFATLDEHDAKRVKHSTDAIEELADKIESNVFETIARRQPVASDLRKLATYLQVSHHLYRVGRYAYKIAHIVTLAQGLEHYKELESLPRMANMAVEMLRIAMDAILTGDLSRIDELEKIEAESDRETEEMFQEITDFLRKRRDIVRMSMLYVIVGRYFERAADHAFSIAERAVYMVTGKKTKLGLAYKKGRESIGPH